MRTSTITAVLAAALAVTITPVAAAFKGFDLGANTATGACKGYKDFKADFKAIKSWPGGFNAVRLYAASDCQTIYHAAPAAVDTGMKLLVGIWTQDQNHYNAEKAALLAAINAHGTTWIAAVSVGSEDLYRKETSASTLAGQINDVRGMVRQFNSGIQVGHTDTWTAWVDPANDAVTAACDFVITDGYPYWQGVAIGGAYRAFFDSVNAVKAHIKNVHNVPVWIGETGWPTGGANFGAAVPARASLRKYWISVGCALIRGNYNFFWYSAFDAPTAAAGVEQFFGVATKDRVLKLGMTCPK